MKNNKSSSYISNHKKEDINKENFPIKDKTRKFKTLQQKSDKLANLHYLYTNNKPLQPSKSENQKVHLNKIKQKQTLKFPPIYNEIRRLNMSKSPDHKPSSFSSFSQNKHTHSMKRVVTQNICFHQSINRKLDSKGQQNIKDTLMKIIQNKSCRQELSLQYQIDKLDILTKRYSHLRKDLVSIQEDLMTINFKRLMKKDQLQNSLTTHFSNIKSINMGLDKENYEL